MDGQLIDGRGRKIEYLRVSVTDRCNLHCEYCMPPGRTDLNHPCDILRYKDLLYLMEIFAGFGVRKIRMTGGEPLVRKGIIRFIDQASRINGIEQIALTTNGILLKRMAGEIRRAGVDRVNISLDSLERARFRSITGHDGFSAAMEGIDAAMKAGFDSVKVNMVVIRGVNDDEVERFADMSRSMPLQVRFIEFMPATPEVWDEKKLVPMSEVKARVERMGALTPRRGVQWSGPAEIYAFDGADGEIGFVSAVTRHFCAECNRLRLTSTGELLTCLFGSGTLDIKAMLRAGASRPQIEDAIRTAVYKKNPVRDMFAGTCDDKRSAMFRVGG